MFDRHRYYEYQTTQGYVLKDYTAKKIAKKMGLTVRYSDMSGLHGYYHTVNKEIVLATSDQTVFFHELAHAIDHKLNADFNKQSKAKCEAVAELTSCVIARMYGIECIGQSIIV